jgi:SagB-type dehydrogenase family enzyme
MADSLQIVFHYHERTKHHLHRHARSLGYLDWTTQPDPFRRFDGAPRLPLEHPPLADQPSYDALFETDAITAQPVNRSTVSALFYDSLAMSAWKQAPGTRAWSLRINPSSGDLHPTEAYLIAGPVEGLNQRPAVYHYYCYEHALEQRATLHDGDWQIIASQLPPGSLLVALASIYWRESWKYGERAFRYCHHDAGHAIATLAFSARVLGWKTRLVETVSDRDLGVLLGTDRQTGIEAEHPDCLLALIPGELSAHRSSLSLRLGEDLLERRAMVTLAGDPNRLSPDHHPWPVIDEVVEASRYPEYAGAAAGFAFPIPHANFEGPPRDHPARKIIRQRRSAVSMDGHTRIGRSVFYGILSRLIPRPGTHPWAVLPWLPQVSLALFVHRVEGLEPGLYLLSRHPAHESSLRTALSGDFLWTRPQKCPPALDLFRLATSDVRKAAKIVSCHQEIAADGVFSLGMLARFEPALHEHGPWFYPRLFWETGVIGQVLYLEAEAAGIRGTGIGCFFDDAMHDILGIGDRSWQSLYHFTLGGPVDDPRLKTIAPYAHLGRE